jgi:hypothetical protein
VFNGELMHKLSKSYKDFENLENSLRVLYPDIGFSLVIPKTISWFKKDISSETREIQLKNLSTFVDLLQSGMSDSFLLDWEC